MHPCARSFRMALQLTFPPPISRTSFLSFGPHPFFSYPPFLLSFLPLFFSSFLSPFLFSLSPFPPGVIVLEICSLHSTFPPSFPFLPQSLRVYNSYEWFFILFLCSQSLLFFPFFTPSFIPLFFPSSLRVLFLQGDSPFTQCLIYLFNPPSFPFSLPSFLPPVLCFFKVILFSPTFHVLSLSSFPLSFSISPSCTLSSRCFS